jgi:hypothetical protein
VARITLKADAPLKRVIEGIDESESVLVLPSTHLFEVQQDLQNWLNRRIGVPGIKRS